MDGRIINRLLDNYAMYHKNVRVCDSLGVVRYLSAMRYCNMVIGNSSSGILEAPTFQIPTINIGDRQKGRIKAQSIVDSSPDKNSIIKAMQTADSMMRQGALFNSVCNSSLLINCV